MAGATALVKGDCDLLARARLSTACGTGRSENRRCGRVTAGVLAHPLCKLNDCFNE
jgi:hypothetical protein